MARFLFPSQEPDNNAIIIEHFQRLLRNEGVNTVIGSLSSKGIYLGGMRPMIPYLDSRPPNFRVSVKNMLLPERKTSNKRKLEMADDIYPNKTPWGKFDKDVRRPQELFLYHTRDTLFPKGQNKPSFDYNWYSSIPYFFPSPVTYQYKIIGEIDELLIITEGGGAGAWNAFGRVIKKLNKLTQEGKDIQLPKLFSDYAIAAFITQVLQLRGLVDGTHFVILSRDTNRFLSEPEINQVGDVEHGDESGPVAIGDNVFGIENEQQYSEEQRKAIRTAILNDALKTIDLNSSLRRGGYKKRPKFSKKHTKKRKRKGRKTQRQRRR